MTDLICPDNGRGTGVSRAHQNGSPEQSPACLEITVDESVADRASVRLVGELDYSNAALLSRCLRGRISSDRRVVRLDVSRLAFCDCAGLGAIVEAHNRLLVVGGTLVLVGVIGLVARLLTVTHLDEALFVADGPADLPRLQPSCRSARLAAS